MGPVTIYYGNGDIACINSEADWLAAPADNVQVVVVHETWPDPLPDAETTGFVYCGRRDATFYTGVDSYDPLHTGTSKRGKLIADAEYFAIWDRAYGDC